MADLPVSFSPAMILGLIRELQCPGSGKTQTRRGLVIRRYRGFSQFGRSDTPGYDWHLRDRELRWHDLRHDALLKLLPYKAGDRLYVREHWRVGACADQFAPKELSPAFWNREAGGVNFAATPRSDWPESFPLGRVRQGMHMPKWASRITLMVREVRVERLLDCTRADALAEGVTFETADPPFYYVPGLDAQITGVGVEEPGGKYPERSYFKLWDHLNGHGAAAVNPWIIAYRFDVRLGNISKIPANDRGGKKAILDLPEGSSC